MTITPADVVRACFQAYEDKDRNAIENLLADDFHFTTRHNNRIDRRTYFERCWPHCEQMASFSIQRLLMDGDHVWVISTADERCPQISKCRTDTVLERQGH